MAINPFDFMMLMLVLKDDCFETFLCYTYTEGEIIDSKFFVDNVPNF